MLIFGSDDSKDLSESIVINGEFGKLTKTLAGFYLPVKSETKTKALIKRDSYGFPVRVFLTLET